MVRVVAAVVRVLPRRLAGLAALVGLELNILLRLEELLALVVVAAAVAVVVTVRVKMVDPVAPVVCMAVAARLLVAAPEQTRMVPLALKALSSSPIIRIQATSLLSFKGVMSSVPRRDVEVRSLARK